MLLFALGFRPLYLPVGAYAVLSVPMWAPLRIPTTPTYFDSTHSTIAFNSSSLIVLAGLGGMGILP